MTSSSDILTDDVMQIKNENENENVLREPSDNGDVEDDQVSRPLSKHFDSTIPFP